MKGIFLKEYNANIIRALFELTVKEKPTPQPKGNEVLIRMTVAPINPSDIAFMRGMYNIKKTLPVIGGFEGTGVVVKTGDSENAKELLGKKVSCFSQTDQDGTWADFFLISADNCLQVRDDLPVEQAACFFINPFTAYALYHKCRSYKPVTIIQNAAAGQVGHFIRTFAKKDKLPVINIVRKQKHVEQLNSEGVEFVLCSADENFLAQLQALCTGISVPVMIDAVGGEQTGQILNVLPEKTTLILYGGLSGMDISALDPLQIIFYKKTIAGFNLNEWFENNSRKEIEKVSENLQDMIIRGELEAKINRIFPLSEAKNALKNYISDMSAGKVLFKCDSESY